MRVIYTIVYTAAFILAAPYWLVRGLLNRAYLRNLKARFIGPGKVLPKLADRPRVWVWALSLGEVLSARELVKKLDEAGAEVVVTATTLSGLAAAKSLWPQKTVLPSPLDFRLSTRRFLDLVEPDMLILVETDIWPGILLQMSRRGITGFMAAHVEKADIYLKGRIAQETQQLNLGINGGWHKVYYADLEGPYVLVFRPDFGHDKNVFIPESIICRQGHGNFDRHIQSMPKKKENYKLAQCLIEILTQIYLSNGWAEI